MKKSRILRNGLGAALLGAAAAQAQQPLSNEELLKVIQQQSAQLEALSQRLQGLEQSQKQIKTVVMEANEAIADASKKADKIDSKFQLPKQIDQLTLKGDLRVRYEQRDRGLEDNKAADGDRSRFRTRFRLGGVWTNKSEAWEIGAGVATGGADGRSTNDTWGDEKNGVFETGDLRLDYAYAKHKFELLEMPASITLGQQVNPFVTTMLNWDGDLRPAGFTFQLGDPAGKDYSGAFATAGGYVIRWLSDGSAVNGNVLDKWDDSVNLFALQTGYKHKGEDASWLAALGYSHVTGAYRNSDVFVQSSLPNNTIGLGDTDYTYDVVDLYGEYKTTIGGFEVKPYAHVAYNLGADGTKSQVKGPAEAVEPSDEALAWMLGVDAKRGKWKFGYAYAAIGADAVFGPMRDSDFGETAGLRDTDVQGHVLKLGYNVSKNFELGATWMMLDRISEVAATEPDRAQMLQLDAVYKF